MPRAGEPLLWEPELGCGVGTSPRAEVRPCLRWAEGPARWAAWWAAGVSVAGPGPTCARTCAGKDLGAAPFTGEHLVFVLRSGNALVDGHVSKRQAGDRQETILSTKYLSFSFTV